MHRTLIICFLLLGATVVFAADKKLDLPSFPFAKLKEGGYVVFQRHARREEIPSQAKLWELDRLASCERGGSLNSQGESESRLIAKAIKEQGIPAGEVLASPTCRTKQMAHILFGDDFKINNAIAPEWTRSASRSAEDNAALKALLTAPVAAGTNRFLISHGKLLKKDAIGQDIPLEQTEAGVFRPVIDPDGKPAFEFFGVIRLDNWEDK